MTATIPDQAEAEPTPGQGSDSAGQGSEPAGTPSQRMARWRFQPMVVVAFLVFFGPAMVGLCGVRAQATENRPLRSFPAMSAGWGFLPGFDGWAVDHTPLRDKMVRVNDGISEGLFGEISPAAPASKFLLKGDNNWLFYREDTRLRCSADALFQAGLDGADRLGRLLQARKIQYVFVVVPDKSTVEAASLPDSYPYQACGTRNSQHFWERMRTNPPAGNLDMLGPLQALRQRNGHAYWATDTHWLPDGAAEYASRLAQCLKPGIGASARVVRAGTRSVTTDLSTMRGRPAVESAPDWRIDGAGGATLINVATGGNSLITVDNSGTAAPLVPGRTLFIGDSFTANSLTQVMPYYQSAAFMHVQATRDIQATANLISQSSAVVIEVVERSMTLGWIGLFSPETIDQLAAAMPPV